MKRTLLFAIEELNKYTRMITGKDSRVSVSVDRENGAGDIFYENCEISVERGEGTIAANCERAALLGVYAYLREVGCRFVRPGKRGEIIPEKNAEELSAHFVFSPENRHRGITIEGAVSVENVLEIIDWAPKAGFNSYFTQFTTSYEFFERWYKHKSNPYLEEEKLSDEDVRRYFAEIVSEIKKRSMIYHAVGHGWTTLCIGIDCNGWSETEEDLSEEKKAMLAEINGERKFYKNKPLNTNLCYSSEKVREALSDKVAEYAETHPEVDVLHFWLADDFNNVCECEECKKRSVSDHYVKILNRIDEKLTEKRLDTKICFLVYFDLYWPPDREKIKNENRFIMMFAPIFRSYLQPFAKASEADSAVMEYRRNKIEYPRSTGTYLAFLREWKKVFKGDSFDFDYHLMWDINRDFSGETIAEVLYDDIRSLKGIGLNGLISCQIQRAFYPNGFAFYLMGRALTDGRMSFADIREEYYSAAYGKYAPQAKEIYETIKNKVGFAYTGGEKCASGTNPDLFSALAYLKRKEENFIDAKDCNETVKESLKILHFVVSNVYRAVKVIVLKEENAPREEIEKADAERKNYFNSRELEFQPYADGFYVNMIVDGIIEAKAVGIYADE